VRLPQVGRADARTDAVLILLANINLILLVRWSSWSGGTSSSDPRAGAVLGRISHPPGGPSSPPCCSRPLLFLLAQSFVGNSIERWFNREVERALKGSLVAHTY
jgi:hypothetical protein